MTREAPVSQPS